ncbi:p80 [Scenedesmus sp. PABB004]|nr:p80 [Scenedesmus sp. PABB004]
MRAVAMLLVALMALSSVTGQQHGAMHAAAPAASSGGGRAPAAAAQLDSCVAEPLAANCSAYEFPLAAAAADAQRLCGAMHFMAACSVAKACNASGAGPLTPRAPGAARVSANDPDVCQPFNHVATVCRLDTGMGRMAGCAHFATMCVPGSRVPACAELPGLSALPTSEAVNKQVRSICEEMTMDGCERCMPSWAAGRTWADCDLLDTYGQLCYAMPEMPQCAEWHAMCGADASLAFCHGAGGGAPGGSGGGSGGGGPVMKMYFFNELPFYLLFKSWTPRTPAGLAGAWFAVFALGLLYEALQMAYGRLESAAWARVAAARGSAGDARPPAGVGGAFPPDLEAAAPLADGDDARGTCCGGAGGGGGGGGSYEPPPLAPRGACCGAGALALAGGAGLKGGLGLGGGARIVASSTGSSGVSGVSGVVAARGRPCCAGGAPPPRRPPAPLRRQLLVLDVARGAARFVLAGLAYLLMLAAMSYHVAIFFAVITGVGVGSALFGRWRFAAGTAEGYSHCGCGSS